MGFLSCNAESAITTCDPYNTKPTKPHYELRQFSSSDLHTATNNFSTQNLLGKGSHGYVYKALLDNKKLLAAVKKPNQTKPYSTPHFNPQIPQNTPAENEIEVLSRVRHARIVNLLGYATDHKTKSKLTVVEFMPNGSLFDSLHGSDKTQTPGWVRRIRFALQVSKAVQHLHSSNPPIIHRDIKSSNVLIDGDYNARLGDFGLALRGHVEDARVMSTPPAGTLGYLDPGYLSPADLSTKSDVFSFGILLLELITGRKAIDLDYSPSSVVDWAVPAIKSGDFAGICDRRIGVMEDEVAARELGVLAVKCVRESVVKRPGMAEVVEVLKRVYMRLHRRIWNRIGRRVGECARGGRFEMVEERGEILKHSGSRRNRKVSSVTSVQIEVGHGESRELKYENNGTNGLVVRSRSISSIIEVNFGQLDESNCGWRKGGFAMKMHTSSNVRLSKSRSMGVLQCARQMSNNDRKLEEVKLLVNLGNETHEDG